MRISDWSSDVCSSDLPVQGEAARAAVLASLASVNRVVIFGDDTPLAAIAALRPDVLVKGADYSLEQRSEEHTSELQSLMRISYAVFCLKKKKLTTGTAKHTKIPETNTQTQKTQHKH